MTDGARAADEMERRKAAKSDTPRCTDVLCRLGLLRPKPVIKLSFKKPLAPLRPRAPGARLRNLEWHMSRMGETIGGSREGGREGRNLS